MISRKSRLGTDAKVAVLGAGPGGLAAAHYLASRGTPTHTFESNPYIGGLCVTLEQGGFRFDLGGHRWFTKNPELHQWLLRLMEGELVTVQRTSRIYFDRKFYNYPISPMNVLKNTGVINGAHAVLSYIKACLAGLVTSEPPANLKAAFTAQFGNQIFEQFFRRYTEKVWGRPCEEISADWASQRTKGLSLLTNILDALIKSRNVVSLVDEFVYPRDGYQRICDRMAEDIEAKGHPIDLSSPVTSLIYDGPNDFRVVYKTPTGETEVKATEVISTIPLTHLVRMLKPACPPNVTEAAKALKFRDLITVTVMLRKQSVTSDTWLYVHDEKLLFARLHEPKNWSPALVPGDEFTSLVCECFCSHDEPIWAMTDEEISDRVISDLVNELGFIETDEVIDTCVVRTRRAYPIYDLEYKDRVKLLYDFVGRHKGLHAVGRGGAFRYNNADHSIEMGQLLAKRLLGEDTDHMSVNTKQEYLEEIRVSLATAEDRAFEDRGTRAGDEAVVEKPAE